MASKMDSGSDEMMTEINITPFVDVMLVLLVIFMISAPAVYSSALRVQTPVVNYSEKVQGGQHVTLKLEMVGAGEVVVEGRKFKTEEIGSFVKDVLKTDPAADVVLSADSSLSHGQVMTVVEKIKSGGIESIAFGVRGNTN